MLIYWNTNQPLNPMHGVGRRDLHGGLSRAQSKEQRRESSEFGYGRLYLMTRSIS